MSGYFRAWGFMIAAVVVGCGSSTPKPASGTAEAKSAIGGACKGDADCSNGLTCDTGDPGGQCQKKCASSADCGAGAVCSDEKKCYAACQSNADCKRDGYACMGDAPNKFCDVASEGKDEGGKAHEQGETPAQEQQEHH